MSKQKYVALNIFNPIWSVPSDLYTLKPDGGVEEEPLWALFSADRLAELRAAISAKMAADPAWHPSDDLTRKLHSKEVHALIDAALKAKHWHQAVNIAEAEARSIDIQDVQLRWDIAEAYKEIRRTNKAFELLYSILATSRDPVQRVVTAQKAISYLPMTDAEKLIGMGQSTPDGHNEFEPIWSDITRARMSAFLHDVSAHEVTAADLEQVQTAARGSDDPNQAGLLAWFYYKRGDLREALEWFKWSLAHGGDAMIAHGLAHTLRRLEKLRETEEVAFAWRAPLVNNNILFVDVLERDLTKEIPPYIEPARLARYAQVTTNSQSGEGAQALAWYAYNSCQFDTALTWFRHAVAWLPKEATVYGYALTLRKLKKSKEFFEIVNRYDGLFPHAVEVIFPDGLYHAPSRCDPQGSGRRNEPAIGAAGFETREPPPSDGLLYLGDVHAREERARPSSRGAPTGENSRRVGTGSSGDQRSAYARVPSADLSGRDNDASRMPVLKRDEFPIAVRAENDLRYDAGGAHPEFSEGVSLSERLLLVPLTARRVPGVVAMPYEKYGFALLPGWTGVTTPSETPASRLPPAAGTRWAAEISDDAAAAKTSAAPTLHSSSNNDPAQSRLP